MVNRMTPAQHHVFRYHHFQIDKSQPLGHGSYGAVYKAKCDQLPCAAKVLHPTIVDPSNHDPGAVKIMDRFSQECAFLESIRHPNIVQYLAMTMDPESRLPVLLMELLDESLTKMLECSQQSLAYYIQVDICHDVALAIAYLHSNNIIHRDLSSNNVLIIAGRRAKVTDFGMSKLVSADLPMTTPTMCPGTLAYMPPEALREPPRYTNKLDCFSEGVLMIQVCTRLWPKPGPRTQIVPFPTSPTGTTEMPVLEIERRKNHIDLIDPHHPVLPIATDCLKYNERKRPSSEELCQRLADLKESTKYRESVDQQQDETTQRLREKDEIIQTKDRLLRQHQEEIASRERQLRQLNQQLEEQEKITAEIQQTNNSLQRRVEKLQQQLSQQTPDHKPHPPKGRQLKGTLTWRDGGKAPFRMYEGATVVERGVAYFLNVEGKACSYDSTIEKWSELPKCPYNGGSLAVINGKLTDIGGCTDVSKAYTYTNKLLSLRGGWSEVLPPMPTKRRGTTAITSNKHLIVAGGATGPGYVHSTKTVEVMDTRTSVWSTVARLPYVYSWASSTICGDHVYMLGRGKLVLTCSLTELLQSSSSSSSVWHRVADAPAYGSTCAAINDQLLAVGGFGEGNIPTTAIYQYKPTTNSWDYISDMLTARFACLVAVLPTNEMMVVGGKTSRITYTDKVEIAIAT